MTYTKVVFRKDKKSKDIIAFLPETRAFFGKVMSYQHIGQHSEADYNYYQNDTAKVDETEYRVLFEELQGIYDGTLKVYQKISYNDLKKAWY